MECAHERAGQKASKILQSFFVIFVIAVIAILAINILNKTDGTVIMEDKENPACWTSSKDIIEKRTGDIKAVKCKE